MSRVLILRAVLAALVLAVLTGCTECGDDQRSVCREEQRRSGTGTWTAQVCRCVGGRSEPAVTCRGQLCWPDHQPTEGSTR